jgi:hypothetical protein
MILSDTPESRREIDRLLDPDNFVEEDKLLFKDGVLTCDLMQLGRVLIRSVRAMSEMDKAILKATLQGRIGSKTDEVQ